MQNRKLQCNGILPPVTTPFDAKGQVDFEGLRHNVARYNETGLIGYVALGSNGEAAHLTTDEQTRVIETIKQAARPDQNFGRFFQPSARRPRREAAAANPSRSPRS